MANGVISNKFGIESIRLANYAVNGCTVYGQAIRFNNMVSLTGSWFNSNGITTGHIIENIPSDFIPSSDVQGCGMTTTSAGKVLSGVPEVSSNGYIREASTSGTKTDGSFAFCYSVS